MLGSVAALGHVCLGHLQKYPRGFVIGGESKFRCSENKVLSAWSQKDFCLKTAGFGGSVFLLLPRLRQIYCPSEEPGGQEPICLPVPGWDTRRKN